MCWGSIFLFDVGVCDVGGVGAVCRCDMGVYVKGAEW